MANREELRAKLDELLEEILSFLHAEKDEKELSEFLSTFSLFVAFVFCADGQLPASVTKEVLSNVKNDLIKVGVLNSAAREIVAQ